MEKGILEHGGLEVPRCPLCSAVCFGEDSRFGHMYVKHSKTEIVAALRKLQPTRKLDGLMKNQAIAAFLEEARV